MFLTEFWLLILSPIKTLFLKSVLIWNLYFLSRNGTKYYIYNLANLECAEQLIGLQYTFTCIKQNLMTRKMCHCGMQMSHTSFCQRLTKPVDNSIANKLYSLTSLLKNV